MDPKELGVEALVTSWLETSLPENLTKQQKDTVHLLFSWLVCNEILHISYLTL